MRRAREVLSAGRAGHLLAPGLAPGIRLLSGLIAFGTCWSDLTCEDFRVGSSWRATANSLQCKKSRSFSKITMCL